ncbi:MAG: hypothetical protein ACFFEK_03955, partial [Candidatus Thorarchaeota archaeon]
SEFQLLVIINIFIKDNSKWTQLLFTRYKFARTLNLFSSTTGGDIPSLEFILRNYNLVHALIVNKW